MLFNSYEFVFVFLPITLVVYWMLRRSHGAQASHAWLLAASLVFYARWSAEFTLLLLGSITVNYALGRILAHVDRFRKLWLVSGLFTNLALLAYFKYSTFAVDNLNALLGTQWSTAQVILPLGISFFTFQQIAYLVDVYRRSPAEVRLHRYALFVTFFPQLIAGPIVHHQHLLPQFGSVLSRHAQLVRNLAIGTTVFVLGLFKKTVLADGIAPLVNSVFDAAAQGADVTFLDAWTASLGYSLQLYFDFCGYSDMALGIAQMFGIVLPANFNAPYRAENIIEFWRRWHITLSQFLRDYIYIPLGGNRKGTARRYANLFATMLLGGLWHGSGWTFVFWGGLHGGYLIVNHCWKRMARPPRNASHRFRVAAYRSLSWATTMLAVIVAWVVFRADSLPAALTIIRGLIGINGISLPSRWRSIAETWIPEADWLIFDSEGFLPISQWSAASACAWIALMSAVCVIERPAQELMQRCRGEFGGTDDSRSISQSGRRWTPSFAWQCAVALMAAASLISMNGTSEFLYYQF